MIMELMHLSAERINWFPAKHGIRKYYSPLTIVTGWTLDYNKHCKYGFGTYLQAHTQNTPTNSMQEHTIDAILKAGVTCLLVTNGGEAISFYHADFKGQVSPPATKVVDTTAAGDAFIGGMLSKIGQHCENKQSFKAFCQTPENIEQTIAYAAKAGAFAVSRYGAFASLPSAADLA